MRKWPGIIMLTVLLLVLAVVTGCGSAGDTGARTDAGSASAAPTGEPLKIGFDEGFTGFMAVDASMTDKGIQTAIAQLGGQALDRPIEYVKADNGSDPVQAVDKARQLVEKDQIDVMLGPIFSPANAAVTDYLAKAGGIPSISIYGHPIDNMKTANGLSFVPTGFYTFDGYYLLGKYCAEELGYKTANVVNYEDTATHQMQEGFNRGFAEGGGKVLSTQWVPIDAIDFSPYFSTLEPADCTVHWIIGNGAAPFIKQYKDYGLTAPLVSLMASNLTEQQMADLGDLSLDIIGYDFYSPEVETPVNEKLVADYREQWGGEYPTMQTFGAWVGVNLFVKGVEATGGDTTPAKLIDAMSSMVLDTPTGTYTFAPYQDAVVAVGNSYIMKTQKVGDRIAWVPVKTFEQTPLFEAQ
jgi:branched-chain amino acid transport system substrate-binding protein